MKQMLLTIMTITITTAPAAIPTTAPMLSLEAWDAANAPAARMSEFGPADEVTVAEKVGRADPDVKEIPIALDEILRI